MANTTTETLTVDGVVLNTYAKNIESLTGRLRTPPMRTGNIIVPGRHGSLRPATRLYGENVISLPMWVRGCDDDGLVPTTKRREFYKNVDALTQLFGYHKSRLDIRHTLPDGSVRQAFGEVLDVIDMSVDDAVNDPVGKFIVTLQMNEPFWQDISDVTQTITGTPGGTTSLANFAGATAPMDELVIRFTGPINNPTITAVYDSGVISSIYATYQANLASGAWVEFNTSTFEWTTGGGAAAFNYANWAHSGGGRLFTLFPGKSAGTPQIHWAGGGSPTGVTALKLTGRRKYLVG
jgi:hypothetical protein